MPKTSRRHMALSPQLTLFDELGGLDYDLDFISNNPILAVCVGPRPHPERIYAPSLTNVRCFWCGNRMRPLDPPAYDARLHTLWQHVASVP
jgi:hypothetical protein